MQQPIDILITPDLIVRCLLGFAVGALIGLERQKDHEDTQVGIRSFGLHSLLGTLAAYTYTATSNPIVLIYATVASLVFLGAQIGHKFFVMRGRGLTTSIVFALSFVLGALVGLDAAPPPGQYIGSLSVLAMAVSFLVFLVLSFKEEISETVTAISKQEMISAAQLAVLIFFLWPLIPQTIFIGTIEFPVFTVYVMVVILLSISFANYILVKKYKERGRYYFAFFGGFANSEATVASLTETYVNSGRIHVGKTSTAAIMANISMVLRNGIIVIILEWTLASSIAIFNFYLVPLAILTLMGIVSLLQARRQVLEGEEGEIADSLGSPFEFGAALRFSLVFTAVSFFSLILQTFFSDLGMLVAAFVGGFASAGAVVTIATPLYTSGAISLATAVYAVIIATVTSVMNKIIYVYSLDREMTLFKRVARDAVIMAAGALVYVLVLALGYLPVG
ncbi:MAG: MgtC/SapB family protein [Candidatus Thorarchaeota archaeon]|nr:MAG: MgtC/SapB family protein [Candidatus Thorarchaeota archaeon]